MTRRVSVLLGTVFGVAAHAGSFEVPKAMDSISSGTSTPAVAIPASAVSVAPSAVRTVSRASPTSPQVLQSEQLAILHQERRALLVTLDAEVTAANKPGAPPDSTARVRRVQVDVQSIDREIARATKGPPPTVSNSTPGAYSAPIGSVARATATPTASTVTPMTSSSPEPMYEAWDVFKNFGKQGALQ